MGREHKVHRRAALFRKPLQRFSNALGVGGDEIRMVVEGSDFIDFRCTAAESCPSDGNIFPVLPTS